VNTHDTYDVAIIGAGPAGLSAGITARACNKKTLIISNKPQDSPLAKAKLVENYPGMPDTSGLALLTTMVGQAEALGCEFVYARVITVLPIEGKEGVTFSITTSGDYIESRTVLLALGTQIGGSLIDGEMDYLGRGVSYCAVCDGMLYRNSTVCVVARSPEALKEAEFLAELGADVHYCVTRWPSDHKIPAGLQVHECTVLRVEGDDLGVTGVSIRKKTEQGAEESVIDCQAVFILRPSIAPDSLLPSLKLRDGMICVDENMCTNQPGAFAAGDCTGKPLQIAKATGEGQIACFSAVEYLDALQTS